MHTRHAHDGCIDHDAVCAGDWFWRAAYAGRAACRSGYAIAAASRVAMWWARSAPPVSKGSAKSGLAVGKECVERARGLEGSSCGGARRAAAHAHRNHDGDRSNASQVPAPVAGIGLG